MMLRTGHDLSLDVDIADNDRTMTYLKKYMEQIIWTLALVFLFFMDTTVNAPSFCLFKAIGFHFCPGCGIGHAIHYALHFNFVQSFHAHILGIPATFGILYTILKPIFTLKQSLHNGRTKNVFDVSRNTAG